MQLRFVLKFKNRKHNFQYFIVVKMLMLSEHDASLYGKTNSLHRMIKKP